MLDYYLLDSLLECAAAQKRGGVVVMLLILSCNILSCSVQHSKISSAWTVSLCYTVHEILTLVIITSLDNKRPQL